MLEMFHLLFDCLMLIALKNDLSRIGKGMLIWQFTGSIQGFNSPR